ncbi:hypothetical protein [Curtobacterium sp. USHLN213]|uniref:hypothetical protein n=1 Tax=Curtobacterium sp. USHLN213 TaxID=3081255 RepID=UPI003017D768
MDEPGLRRVKECHPILEDAVQELFSELGVVDERRLGQVLAGEDRLPHGQLLFGGLGTVDDGEVRQHSGEHLVDPDGGQP